MARKSSKNKSNEEREVIATRISIKLSEDTHTYYANFAEVTHSPHEYIIYFCRTPAKLDEHALEMAKASQMISVEADLEVMFPPTMIDGLIDALKSQKEKYKEARSFAKKQK